MEWNEDSGAATTYQSQQQIAPRKLLEACLQILMCQAQSHLRANSLGMQNYTAYSKVPKQSIRSHSHPKSIAHRSRQKKASTQHQSMHLQLLNNAHRPISKTSTTKHAQQCNSKRASTRQSPDSSPSHKTSPFDRGKKRQHATAWTMHRQLRKIKLLATWTSRSLSIKQQSQPKLLESTQRPSKHATWTIK